jgi:hypothetical protein
MVGQLQAFIQSYTEGMVRSNAIEPRSSHTSGRCDVTIAGYDEGHGAEALLDPGEKYSEDKMVDLTHQNIPTEKEVAELVC